MGGGVGGLTLRQLTRTAREYLQKNHSAKTYKKKIGTAGRRTDGNGEPISSYSRGHEKSRKCKSRQSTDGFDYNYILVNFTKN